MKTLVSLFIVMLALGCSTSENEEPVAPPDIKLNKNELVLEKGKTERLIAAFSPEDTPHQGHTWSSGSPDVATIDATGLVNALSVGDANITVTALNGKKTAVCKVKVIDKIINVTGISLDQTLVTIAEGKSMKITSIVIPENATDKSVKWSSNNSQVATVDGLGNVTAISKGNATISATTNDGNKASSCQIAVVKPGVEISVPIISNVSANTAELTGTFKTIDVTVEEVGLCYAVSPSPTISNHKVILSGEKIEYTLNGLNPETTYYVRLYAKYKNEISYGDQALFTTLPVVKTNFQPIEYRTTHSDGDIIHFVSQVPASINEVTVCYGVSPNPRITDNTTIAEKNNEDGKLHLILKNLQPGKNYYVRSYQQTGNKVEYANDEVCAQTMGGDEFKITYKFKKIEYGPQIRYGYYEIYYEIKPEGTYLVTNNERNGIMFQNNPVGEYQKSCYIENGKGVFYTKITELMHVMGGTKTTFPIDMKFKNIETNIVYYHNKYDYQPYEY